MNRKSKFVYKSVLAAVFAAAALPSAAVSVRMASEPYVDAALAVGATAATNYTDAATNATASALRREIAAVEEDVNIKYNNITSTMDGFLTTETDPAFGQWLAANTNREGVLTHADWAMNAASAASAIRAEALFEGEDGGRMAADILDSLDASTAANAAQDARLDAVEREASLVYRLYSSTNVILEVTNYNSAVRSPSMRLLSVDTNGTFSTIWTETNLIAKASAAATNYTDAATNALRSVYAPRAWCATTSGLGADAPEGVTWISTPQTVIAGGYEYEKFATSGGAVWILTANGMTADFTPSSTSAAFLDISANDGTSLFRIEKTDSQLVGVDADGISVREEGGRRIATVSVDVASATHPFLRACDDLVSADWVKETADGFSCGWATVSWDGSPGAWVATISSSSPQAYFYFEFEKEGSAVVRNTAALDVSEGGILCTDGVHRVRPVYANGAITWEVVQ